MRQNPFRPGNEISQAYNDGLVSVYRVSDGGEPGYAPVPRLELRVTLRYAELKLGILRFYSAKQNNAQVERVLRVPRRPDLSSQDVAVTEDGRRYRIGLVQLAKDVFPPSLDLTLEAVEQDYEFPEEGSNAVV